MAHHFKNARSAGYIALFAIGSSSSTQEHTLPYKSQSALSRAEGDLSPGSGVLIAVAHRRRQHSPTQTDMRRLLIFGWQNIGKRIEPQQDNSTQGQRTLSAFSSKDLHQEVNAPTGHATLHDIAFFARMLLDQAQRHASEPG